MILNLPFWITNSIVLFVMNIIVFIAWSNQHKSKSDKLPPTIFQKYKHSVLSNILNSILLIVTAIPASYFMDYLTNECTKLTFNREYQLAEIFSKEGFCYVGLYRPFLTLNISFFVFVNITFWILSILQKSTWLIDPYWTIIPVMMNYFFVYHPNLHANYYRSTISLLIIWLWSIRLTHSYFRREQWNFAAREDWRFTEMSKQHGKSWWWKSFFLAYFSQQVLLVGICSPIYFIHQGNIPFNIYDVLGVVLSVCGVVMAYFADTQLFYYIQNNERLSFNKKETIKLLDTGVWKYSRHPNHFAEQLFWWGFAFFGLSFSWWTFLGTFLNSAALHVVVQMVEKKMIEKKERADLYRNYQKKTARLIPFIHL
eukprot:TRINITY_DN5495_c0_g1_i1.p1 TRINITY_DN5495_c0_g1~~TRINITY_DN5495_c0_g1_i1.p1  ORF type:complete len:369 (+),score=64.23 TRINITY_DN5495_c0_g1_i1:3-1109(+)